jgi:5-oxoprolinase (ATP-hydrolysing) subunit C
VTVQDLGRPGVAGGGAVARGAADRLALLEGAALLGQEPGAAAVEMAGFGGVFEATEPMRIALTGAPMAARAGERALEWNAVHRDRPGSGWRSAARGRGSTAICIWAAGSRRSR